MGYRFIGTLEKAPAGDAAPLHTLEAGVDERRGEIVSHYRIVAMPRSGVRLVGA